MLSSVYTHTGVAWADSTAHTKVLNILYSSDYSTAEPYASCSLPVVAAAPAAPEPTAAVFLQTAVATFCALASIMI